METSMKNYTGCIAIEWHPSLNTDFIYMYMCESADMIKNLLNTKVYNDWQTNCKIMR